MRSFKMDAPRPSSSLSGAVQLHADSIGGCIRGFLPVQLFLNTPHTTHSSCEEDTSLLTHEEHETVAMWWCVDCLVTFVDPWGNSLWSLYSCITQLVFSPLGARPL